jgi:hypothetical protein
MMKISAVLAVAGAAMLGCASRAELESARAELAAQKQALSQAMAERDSCRGRLSLLEKAASNAPSPTNTASTPAPQQPLPLLGSKEIIRAYEENEVAADERFKGRRVLIVGHVQQISKTLGHPSVTVGPERWPRRTNCRFDDDSEDPATFRRGQLVVLSCSGAGMTLLRSPAFEHCSFVDPVDIAPQYPALIARSATGAFSLVGALKDELKD